MSKEKLIVVSFGTPYIIPHYLFQVPLSVNAYGNAQSVQKAFVGYLLSNRELSGKSPVKLTLLKPNY